MQSRRDFLAIVGAFVFAPAALAKRGDWVLLGTRRVNLLKDRDVIYVGLSKGFFSGLKLRATRGGIFIERLRVRFLNDDVADLTVRSFLRAGQETGHILLPSLLRGIKLIELVYRRAPLGGEAQVAVFGREV